MGLRVFSFRWTHSPMTLRKSGFQQLNQVPSFRFRPVPWTCTPTLTALKPERTSQRAILSFGRKTMPQRTLPVSPAHLTPLMISAISSPAARETDMDRCKSTTQVRSKQSLPSTIGVKVPMPISASETATARIPIGPSAGTRTLTHPKHCKSSCGESSIDRRVCSDG